MRGRHSSLFKQEGCGGRQRAPAVRVAGDRGDAAEEGRLRMTAQLVERERAVRLRAAGGGVDACPALCAQRRVRGPAAKNRRRRRRTWAHGRRWRSWTYRTRTRSQLRSGGARFSTCARSRKRRRTYEAEAVGCHVDVDLADRRDGDGHGEVLREAQRRAGRDQEGVGRCTAQTWVLSGPCTSVRGARGRARRLTVDGDEKVDANSHRTLRARTHEQAQRSASKHQSGAND
jgi:hypothetical protein